MNRNWFRAAAALLAATLARAQAAPADEAVLGFFQRPEHSLSRSFSSYLEDEDIPALRRCLTLLAEIPVEQAHSELLAAHGVTMAIEDLAAAASEAKALLTAAPAGAQPLGAGPRQAAKLVFAAAGPMARRLSEGLDSDRSAALFDGAGGPDPAQPVAAPKRSGEFYLSWGYNSNRYAPTDIHFSQANGNEFTLHGVRGRDDDSWKELFDHALTVPQYNVVFGYFFGHNAALELNFQHSKFIVEQGQSARLTGIVDGEPVDRPVVLDEDLLKYKLNNGANFVLFNLVKRIPLLGEPGRTGSIAALAKAGVGFVLPHTENTVLGRPNEKGFQFMGPDAGLEAAIRFHFLKNAYLEFAQKGVFANYPNVNIHDGKASHHLWTHASLLSLGMSFNAKRN